MSLFSVVRKLMTRTMRRLTWLMLRTDRRFALTVGFTLLTLALVLTSFIAADDMTARRVWGAAVAAFAVGAVLTVAGVRGTRR